MQLTLQWQGCSAGMQICNVKDGDQQYMCPHSHSHKCALTLVHQHLLVQFSFLVPQQVHAE